MAVTIGHEARKQSMRGGKAGLRKGLGGCRSPEQEAEDWRLKDTWLGREKIERQSKPSMYSNANMKSTTFHAN